MHTNERYRAKKAPEMAELSLFLGGGLIIFHRYDSHTGLIEEGNTRK